MSPFSPSRPGGPGGPNIKSQYSIKTATFTVSSALRVCVACQSNHGKELSLHHYLEAHAGQVGQVVPDLPDHLEHLEHLGDQMGLEAQANL